MNKRTRYRRNAAKSPLKGRMVDAIASKSTTRTRAAYKVKQLGKMGPASEVTHIDPSGHADGREAKG